MEGVVAATFDGCAELGPDGESREEGLGQGFGGGGGFGRAQEGWGGMGAPVKEPQAEAVRPSRAE